MSATIRSIKEALLEQIGKEIVEMVEGCVDKDMNDFQKTRPSFSLFTVAQWSAKSADFTWAIREKRFY